MTTDAPAITIERIDHGVLPSNDLGRAHRFWSDFMGGVLERFVNVNMGGLNRNVPEMVFYTVANHHGWGIALQDYPFPNPPKRELEGVVWGFEVAADTLDAALKEAQDRGIRVTRPIEAHPDSRIAQSLHILDTDGNPIELVVRRDASDATPQGEVLPLRRISHCRVDVLDLEKAVAWYRDTFGLVEDDEVPGEKQVQLIVPATGQLVILKEVEELADKIKFVKGPHIDFRIPHEHYPTILDRFQNREFYWGPDPTKIPWHEIGGHTVYGYDPFGNRIQIGEAFDH
jgi:catechol 2,3-dioxygenase-like lactoylglutathione lyase family enzyme